MENNLMVDENKERSDHPTIVSKSTRTAIAVHSIYVDLTRPKEKSDAGPKEKNDVAKCDKFTIRGFVAGIREKDRKKCWPFALDGNDDKLYDQPYMLPPIDVVEFRYWRCQNCVRDIDANNGIGMEDRMVRNCCSSTFSQIPYVGDGANTKVNTQQPSEIGSAGAEDTIFQGQENVLESTTTHKTQSPTRDAGPENGSVDDTNHKIHSTTCGASEVDPYSIAGGQENGSENIANCKTHSPPSDAGKVDPCLNDSGSEKGPEDNTNCTVYSLNRGERTVNTCSIVETQTGNTDAPQSKTGFEFHKQNCEIHEAVDVNLSNSNLESARGNQHRDAIPVLEPSEVADVAEVACDRDNGVTHDDDYDSPGNCECRNSSSGLTLNHKRTRKVRSMTELLNSKENLKNNTNQADVASRPLSVPRGWVDANGKVGSGFRSHKRKRKLLPRDELQTVLPNSVIQKVKIIEDRETSGVKERNVCIIDENLNLGKNQSGGIQVDSSVPLREFQLKENQEKNRDVQSESHDKNREAKSKGIGDQIDWFNSHFIRDAGFLKEKKKTPQIENGQSSGSPWPEGMLGESETVRRDTETTRAGPEIVQFQSTQREPTRKGLNVDLNSCSGLIVNDGTSVPQVENGIDYLVPRPESNASIPFDSSSSIPSFGNDINYSGTTKGTADTMVLMGKKQNCIQKDLCGAFRPEKTVEPQQAEVLKKRSGHKAGKAIEQGTSDDIPMEIVELMARNQYERGLHKTAATNFSEPYYHSLVRFSQENNLQIQHSVSIDAPNSGFTRNENVGPTKNFFPHVNETTPFNNMVQLHESYGSKGFGLFSRASNRLQQPDPASSSRSRTWSSDFTSHRSSQPSLQQTSEGYSPWRTVTPFTEEANLGFSSMPRSQNYMNMLSKSPDTVRSEKVNGKDREKQGRNFDYPHNRNEVQPRLQHGALELYSNETIPALHLLSLMDAGVPTNQRHHFDGLSGLRAGELKANQKSRQSTYSTFQGRNEFSGKAHEYMGIASSANCGNIGNTACFPKQSSLKHEQMGKAKFCNLLPKQQRGRKQQKLGHIDEVPKGGGVPFWIRNGGNFGISTSFAGQGLFKHQEKEKAESSCQPPKRRGRKPKHSIPAEQMQWPSTHNLGRPTQMEPATLETGSETVFCRVNQNPADFTSPEPGNKFMIGAQDLKFFATSSKNKRGLVSTDGRKRHKAVKFVDNKELGRHHIS